MPIGDPERIGPIGRHPGDMALGHQRYGAFSGTASQGVGVGQVGVIDPSFSGLSRLKGQYGAEPGFAPLTFEDRLLRGGLNDAATMFG